MQDALGLWEQVEQELQSLLLVDGFQVEVNVFRNLLRYAPIQHRKGKFRCEHCSWRVEILGVVNRVQLAQKSLVI